MREFDFGGQRIFRLRVGAVDCDGDGIRIAGLDLLDRGRRPDGRSEYALPPCEEVEERLWRAYGYRVSAVAKLGGIRVVADALNRGELARAQIAALSLKLPEPNAQNAPEPSPVLAKQLHGCGWFLKNWDPDERPRTGTPPNPGWFAPTKGGDDAHSAAAPSSASVQSDTPKPSTTAASGNPEQEVAILTSNFNYACRALQLDRNIAIDILHQLKEHAGLEGDDNCTFDTETGNVYFNGEHIGNLRD